MIERMDRMHDEMMKGFGGGSLMKMMGDPFKDDPFFNRGPGFGDMFERADKMMAEMNRGFDEGAPLAKGHFYKQTYHQKGNDVYQTKAHGAIGGGNKIVDRQQMFENKQKGISKAAHERMLNG